jgi:hypothetical protein
MDSRADGGFELKFCVELVYVGYKSGEELVWIREGMHFIKDGRWKMAVVGVCRRRRVDPREGVYFILLQPSLLRRPGCGGLTSGM